MRRISDRCAALVVTIDHARGCAPGTQGGLMANNEAGELFDLLRHGVLLRKRFSGSDVHHGRNLAGLARAEKMNEPMAAG